MKLCVLSITAVLATFVVANPILNPRAPSRPFRLFGKEGLGLLTVLPVAEANHPGYFRFGWYGKGSQKIELFFSQYENRGPVFDYPPKGYEMVVQEVTDLGRPGGIYYRPLLIVRTNTALSGLHSRFYTPGDYFYSIPEDQNGSWHPEDPNGMRWMTCIRSATRVATDPQYVEDLIL